MTHGNSDSGLAIDLLDAFDLVEEGAKRFRFYEKSHRDKKTEDGDAKAISNGEIAERFEAFLVKGTEFAHDETDAVRDLFNKRRAAKALLQLHLPNLDKAAKPTSSDVFAVSGHTARAIHDAIVLLTS